MERTQTNSPFMEKIDGMLFFFFFLFSLGAINYKRREGGGGRTLLIKIVIKSKLFSRE
jgi:hypothetical protein